MIIKESVCVGTTHGVNWRLKMLTDKEWEEFRYDLIEGGFFDYEARPKTLKAVRRALPKAL